MTYFDYADVKGFLKDDELVRLLYADRTYPQLVDTLMQDDFLVIDTGIKVPFFAEVRDYVGAAERADEDDADRVEELKDGSTDHDYAAEINDVSCPRRCLRRRLDCDEQFD